MKSQLKLVSCRDLCALFNCKRGTIRKWIIHRGFPAPMPCPARDPLFKQADVEAWVEGKSINGGSNE